MPNQTILSLNEISMPYSLESEQAVLGCVLAKPETISRAIVLLKPDYFFIPEHRRIFSAMIELERSNSSIDALVVLELLKKNGTYDDATGKNYLLQLAGSVPSVNNIESYCNIIREKYYVRTLITTSKEIIEDSIGSSLSAEELVDNAEQKIYDIRRGKSTHAPTRIGEIIQNEVLEKLELLSSEDSERFKGVKTGLIDLDKITTGLNRSDLVIVGARPAMGKTSFALNLATNVALNARKKVLFFSLEMTKEQLAERVLSTEARVVSTKMRTGELSDDDWRRIGNAIVPLSTAELYFDDTSNITVPEMKSRIRRLKNVDAVFVDYLQLMKSSTRAESRVNEVSEITRSLKLMAKDLNIPVVVLAQLSRSTEARNNKSHKPQLSDLRESGSIEQDADIVIMLYRDEYYKRGENREEQSEENKEQTESLKSNINKVELIVAKNRHGSTDTVECMWNGDFTLFSNLSKIDVN